MDRFGEGRPVYVDLYAGRAVCRLVTISMTRQCAIIYKCYYLGENEWRVLSCCGRPDGPLFFVFLLQTAPCSGANTKSLFRACAPALGA